MFSKDMIIEIILNLDMKDICNFSLTNKSNYNLIWNNEIFWMRKNEKVFGTFEIKDNRKVFKILLKYSSDPQYFYSKSIFENDTFSSYLIKKAFSVYFPYIGIRSSNENYFGIYHITGLLKLSLIPDYVLDISQLGNLTLLSHCKAMGISCFSSMEREEIISNIINKLTKLNLIFQKGSINPFLDIPSTKSLKIY